MTKFCTIRFACVMALGLAASVRAESGGVASALGLRAPDAAAALDSGASSPWDQLARQRDATRQKMNAETSTFLRNSPRAVGEPESSQKPGKDARKTQADLEREFALRQLEFRQNVEEAMKQILSFNASPRRAAEPPAEPAPAAPLASRDRLIQSAVGNTSRFLSNVDPREKSVPRVEISEIDKGRVRQVPEEAVTDTRPIRVVVSGEEGGDTSIVRLRKSEGTH